MNAQRQRRELAASILRAHFDTEASDAGLRSLDLASAGSGGARSYDAAAVTRQDKRRLGFSVDHRKVRDALKRLGAQHVELVSLAFGCVLRTRDTEDGKSRKAVRKADRNWRVRLAGLYGHEGAAVLASPLARRLFSKHVQALEDQQESAWEAPRVTAVCTDFQTAEDVFARGRNEVLSTVSQDAIVATATAKTSGFITWLLEAGQTHVATITADVRKQLDIALDAFADAYGLADPAQAPRSRSSQTTRARILASHADHGHEIGE